MRRAVRTFVALHLDEAIRRRIDARVDRSLKGVRWVCGRPIHLTLKFLGEVEESRVPTLREALACVRMAPFEIRVRGIGSFPRVIWAGVEGPVASLAERIEAACIPLGFAREDRPFKPHATIGRVKKGRVRCESDADFGAQRVESFALMKSDLRPEGPVYTELETFPVRPG